MQAFFTDLKITPGFENNSSFRQILGIFTQISWAKFAIMLEFVEMLKNLLLKRHFIHLEKAVVPILPSLKKIKHFAQNYSSFLSQNN